MKKTIKTTYSEKHLKGKASTALCSYDDALAHITALKQAYKDSELHLNKVLGHIRNRKYLCAETMVLSKELFTALEEKSSVLERYARDNDLSFIAEGESLDDISQAFQGLKGFEEKMGIILRMAYVCFEDRAANISYENTRLRLKHIANIKADEEDFLKTVETLSSGLETKDTSLMVELYKALMGTFDTGILSSILTKNYKYIDGPRPLLIRGLALTDDEFLSIIHSGCRNIEEYFGSGAATPELKPSPGTTETFEAVLPQDNERKPKAKSTETPGPNNTVPALAPNSTKDKKTTPAAQEKAPAPDVKQENNSEEPLIYVFEGSAKKAFEKEPMEKAAELPDGFLVSKAAVSEREREPGRHPAVEHAISLLEEEGAAAAIEFISKAVENDESLIFVEEQMAYAFNQNKPEYSYSKFQEVFGDEESSKDLFGASVLSCAFSDDVVYDHDREGIDEMIQAKFKDREFASNLKHIFKTLCKFKERNGAGPVFYMARRDAISKVIKEAELLKNDIEGHKEATTKWYQQRNPFLDAIKRIGFNEIFTVMDKFYDSENKGDAYKTISGFLTGNRLVTKDKVTGCLTPDTDGITAYKNRIWDEYSKTPEARKRFGSPETLNDEGKSVKIIRRYRNAVNLLIKCAKIAEEYNELDIPGYLAAEKEAPVIVDELMKLCDKGYDAIDYMSALYAEKIIGKEVS